MKLNHAIGEMFSMSKHRYIMEASLKKQIVELPPDIREIEYEDFFELGKLLYEADLGTVDDKGLPVENSITEIKNTFDGKYGRFLKNCSLLLEKENQIISTVIFTFYEKENQALLAFTMTHPKYKNQGYCQQLLNLGQGRLLGDGYKTCFLAVSAKNLPAIEAYKKAGFSIKKEELP